MAHHAARTITNWKAMASPTYDTSRPVSSMACRGRAHDDDEQCPGRIALLGSSNARNLQYVDGGQITGFMLGGRPANTLRPWTSSPRVPRHGCGAALYASGDDDKSTYDWTKYNVAAPTTMQSARIANLSLDQEIFPTEHARSM